MRGHPPTPRIARSSGRRCRIRPPLRPRYMVQSAGKPVGASARRAETGLMPFARLAPGLSAEKLVAALGDPHRSADALWRLIAFGPDAAPPRPRRAGPPRPPGPRQLLQGARPRHGPRRPGRGHRRARRPRTRGPLERPARPRLRPVQVRRVPAHAAAVLPPALALLIADPSPRVRAGACEVACAWAHSRREAAEALRASACTDPSPAVRKKASWYAPGGPIFRRTQPRTPRTA